MGKNNKILVICGPTATGKTALSVELALLLGGEVVSADSMQIYDIPGIGTARPTPEEMRGVPHFLQGFVPPDTVYSVADYVRDAVRVTEEILARGKLPILVGGTGLYIDSFLSDNRFAPGTGDPEIRLKYKKYAERYGNESLHAKLSAADPQAAAGIHPNNVSRVVRALEVYETTGVPMSEHVKRSRVLPPRYCAEKFCLTYSDRQLLYDKIDTRVDRMLALGLPEEARRVLELPPECTLRQAIGYKEFEPYFAGEISLGQAADNLKKNSRNYAKRQLTWFGRSRDTGFLNVDRFAGTQEIAQYIIGLQGNSADTNSRKQMLKEDGKIT